MDAEAIEDLFSALGPVRTRRMFSGYGVFSGDLCFALSLGGELFLKADAETEASFRAAGSVPFSYEQQGRMVQVAFWRLPDAALDDPDIAAEWARLALAAAVRAAGKRRKKARVSRNAAASTEAGAKPAGRRSVRRVVP